MPKFIIGAYPSAPSFYYRDAGDEREFFRQLAAHPAVGGLEQPCLDEMHPLGNDFLFKTIPGDWKIVCTAIMYTMGQRAKLPGFGLASADEDGRQACVKYYRHILDQMTACRRYGSDRFSHLEIHSAPLKGSADREAAIAAFGRSLQEICAWDWPCRLVIEHCDDLSSRHPSKGFLPLAAELDACAGTAVGVCVNWARCVLERDDPDAPVAAVRACRDAGKLTGLMFSGTATGGDWGAYNDNHVPFAPFPGSRLQVAESLMTVARAAACLRAAGTAPEFVGAKLMEWNRDATLQHRADIVLDGADALGLAVKAAG